MGHMFAVIISAAPAKGWLHVIQARRLSHPLVIDRGKARAFTRNGHDWTAAHLTLVAFVRLDQLAFASLCGPSGFDPGQQL
jgi:hypothetical protein